jgi:hypothetical protein
MHFERYYTFGFASMGVDNFFSARDVEDRRSKELSS